MQLLRDFLRKLLRKLNRLFGIIFLCKLTTDYADYMGYSLVVYYSHRFVICEILRNPWFNELVW